MNSHERLKLADAIILLNLALCQLDAIGVRLCHTDLATARDALKALLKEATHRAPTTERS